jgi:Uma2 family endonuclease
MLNSVLKETHVMTVDAPVRPLSGNMDVDEFMAFLETRPNGEHWELIEGIAVMMAPASYAHQRIASNLCSLLNNAFAARRLDLYAYGDVGVRTPGVKNFHPVPDVAVVPGVAGYELYSERYQLVAEVLSPSNTRQEIDLKLRRYREAPDNLYAVVIEPREFLVEVHAKSRGWEPTVLKRPDDLIEMPEFGLRCVVADLYRGTPLMRE